MYCLSCAYIYCYPAFLVVQVLIGVRMMTCPEPGPTIFRATPCDPKEYFLQFWPPTTLSRICEETNRFVSSRHNCFLTDFDRFIVCVTFPDLTRHPLCTPWWHFLWLNKLICIWKVRRSSGLWWTALDQWTSKLDRHLLAQASLLVWHSNTNGNEATSPPEDVLG